MPTKLRIRACLLLALLVLPNSGCITLAALMGQKKSGGLDTTLLEAQGYSIPRGGMPSPVKLDPNGGPRVVLEVRGDGTHLETIPLPLDSALFIEDLVQQAQLQEKLGPTSISIMRPNGAGAPPLRLDLRTDDNGNATNTGQNYALLPGDHIIVYSDDRSLLEKFVDKQFK